MPCVAKFGGNVRFYESTRTPAGGKKTDSRQKAATLRMSAHKKGGQTMKIRIYKTDFEGNPVECTGDCFSGATALDIVNVMKLGSSALCVKNGNGISGTPVQSSSNPA